MAESKYEYVKKFEVGGELLPNTWIVIRIDGRGFSRFTKHHKYNKPVDERGILLMNKCAQEVMKEFADLDVAYGHRYADTTFPVTQRIFSNLSATSASSSPSPSSSFSPPK